MASKKVLILGARGMLGQELVRVFSLDEQYEVAGWDREDIDITDFAAAEEKVRAYKPEIIVNAVAYNAVDVCEENDEEYKKALLLNVEVPKFLARVTKEIGATLIHYSTDYVFDGALEGTKKEAGGCATGSCCGGNCHGKVEAGYDEAALPNPLSRYGMSKYLGEREVQKEAEKYYLIRLSKLFGKAAASAIAKKSFFEKMFNIARLAEEGKSRQAQEKSEVTVVNDEKSCFTYAPDLAVATKELVESGDSFGIYHLANSGAATWYEGARELYAQAHIGVTIQPVGSDAFPSKALRPKCSVLLNTKRPPLRPYQEALGEYLKNI
ncbi:MAG: NAD(P)-dependent oxidoreductase [Candidatus Moranbacteria bacterium]|nr:NAD(P)-dependent oxidoreductase [Candidatus Moranbacteria bacterium]